MAVSTSPSKRALSPLPTLAMGIGVLVGVGIGDGVKVEVGPGVFDAKGNCEGPKGIKLQLKITAASVNPKRIRKRRFITSLILVKK
jgi:hypothetical protein